MGWLWWEGGVREFDGEDGMIHWAIRPWGRKEGGSEGRTKGNGPGNKLGSWCARHDLGDIGKMYRIK